MTWNAPDGTAGLIFDCDGTLADTMPLHFRAWTAMVNENGLTFPETQFYALAGMPSERIINQLAAEQDTVLPAAQVQQMIRDKEDRYITMIDDVLPIAVVLDVASRYRGVLPMAVASGGERWVVERTLRAIGAFEWFDAMVGSEDTVLHKPEPDVFLEAARRIDVAPANCVVFEDSDLGMLAAERAGMHGIDIRDWL
jgi:HAD superfamily hydrolase (TIGR01509 family)